MLRKDYLRDYWMSGKRLCIETTRVRLKEIVGYMLKQDARLVHVTVADLGIRGFELAHHYALDHIQRHLHIMVKVKVPRESSEAVSVAKETWEASWAEREMAELTGFRFIGHPDPRHLFLPYEWPSTVESGEFDETQVVGRTDMSKEEVRQEMGRWVPLAVRPEDAKATLIPIGPYHPLLIEGIYFRIKVRGEEIVDADLKPGFVHRGIMRLSENRDYWRNIYLFERVCGICSHTHTTAYCNTVELLGEIDLPDRARYIRTLVAELERIHSHLLWLGVAGHLIGFHTLFMLAWRDREHVQDILEIISGNRCAYAMNNIGGVRRDVPKEMIPKIEKKLDILEDATKKFIDIVCDQPVVQARLQGVGVLKTSTAKETGAVGPTARGSNWKIDVRQSDPYAAYGSEYTSWYVIVESGGDVWARTLVRLKELLVAINICRQCLDALRAVGGSIQAEVSEFEAGAEALGKSEAPRGELLYYIKSNGTNIPQTVRIRTPSYRNNACLPYMLKGYEIADAPIIIGSIDPCISCTDRMVIVEDERTGRMERYTLEQIARKYERSM
ncbi:MAG: NADH-quinone oxidoreductase subunit C [Candidatus Bathyarchaeia archaeon]